MFLIDGMQFLYVCTHNRCRSILAEAITNHLSAGRLQAISAGSEPAGQVHPRTLQALQDRGISTTGLASKGWADLAESTPDIIVTVCDRAAGEACPLVYAPGVRVHWGLPDPSSIRGDDKAIDAAFSSVIDLLGQRIRRVLELDLDAITAAELGDFMVSMATHGNKPGKQ